jgi:Bacterial alpha-L-rhamnosidase 6 hairpin glycosidase domain
MIGSRIPLTFELSAKAGIMKGTGTLVLRLSQSLSFVQWCSALWLATVPLLVAFAAPAGLDQQTSSIKVTFDAHHPGLSALSIDSLLKNSFRPSPLIDPDGQAIPYSVSSQDGWARYAFPSHPDHIAWQMRTDGDRLVMRSVFQADAPPQDITLKFDPNVTHATLLGHVTPSGDIALPAVLHLPGMGSMRISVSGNDGAVLHYDARRAPEQFVKVVFPAANSQHPTVEYSLQTAAIYPAVPGIENDPRYDGFRRDFLDIFQQQAEMHVLANHAASDACAFTVYEYADMARYTPELAKRLTALDLVRETLDRYLAGFLGYGMPGYQGFDSPVETGPTTTPYIYSDVYPSLLISAYDYVSGTADEYWLRSNYPKLRNWADAMIAQNSDGGPLIEYPASGNSGSWPEKIALRPANWWDTIRFGHQDAYSNALAYRALRGMAALADLLHESAGTARYRQRAQQIRNAYVPAFLDKDAGVLAGWRSRDGQLHNYYFTFVNGIAALYGLADEDLSRRLMSRTLAKMQSVSYTNFSLGLPGNLVPIRRADYVDLDPRFGGPRREDGSDGFQVYENGGATACFAYFTVAALYKLGENEKADTILMPMLDAFSRQGFSGRAPDGLTYDWKDWHGGAHGYEGFLVDNYYALLAVLDRANMIAKLP